MRELRTDCIGVIVTCAKCGWQKKPIGRSAPFESYHCDDECPGYRQPPLPGSLWPGESEADFGYPVGTAGTTLAEERTR